MSVTIGTGRCVGIGGTAFGLAEAAGGFCGAVDCRMLWANGEVASHISCCVIGFADGQNEYADPTSELLAGAEAGATARADEFIGGGGVLCLRSCS